MTIMFTKLLEKQKQNIKKLKFTNAMKSTFGITLKES